MAASRPIFEQLRKINTTCFPVSYSESFYQNILKRNNEHLNRFAILNGRVVGAVCARLEDGQVDHSQRSVYIMTLAVLAPFRGRGIGGRLLRSVLEYCAVQPVDEVRLHVQISNADAIRFYTEKFGFTRGDMIRNYYRRINPPHCYVIFKRLKASEADDKPSSQVEGAEDGSRIQDTTHASTTESDLC